MLEAVKAKEMQLFVSGDFVLFQI